MVSGLALGGDLRRRPAVLVLLVVAVLVAWLAIAADRATAGTPSEVTGSVALFGSDAATLATTIDIELQGAGPTTVDCTVVPGFTNGAFATASFTCASVPHNILFTVVPIGATGYQPFTAQPSTCVRSGDLTLTLDAEFPTESCSVLLGKPGLVVDKVVGPINGIADGLTSSDFTLEVYGGGSLAAQGADPADATCWDTQVLANCLVLDLPVGDYQLGEIPLPGYVPTAVWCFTNVQATEVFPAGIGEFSLALTNPGTVMRYCQITNNQFGASLDVNKVVVNDDGGTAGPADFTAELYFEQSGALQQSGACVANGACISGTIPVGQYRIGESGPTGYASSVACVVDAQPDPPAINTSVPPPQQPVEAIAGDEALILLEAFGAYTCTITNNDIATTTTTSTSSTTSTTLPVILPPTGSDDSTLPLLLVALGSVAVGLVLVRLRRTA